MRAAVLVGLNQPFRILDLYMVKKLKLDEGTHTGHGDSAPTHALWERARVRAIFERPAGRAGARHYTPTTKETLVVPLPPMFRVAIFWARSIWYSPAPAVTCLQASST